MDTMVATLGQMTPELVLLLTACGMLLVTPFLPPSLVAVFGGGRGLFGGLALVAVAAAFWVWTRQPVTVDPLTGGLFTFDGLADLVRGLTLAAGLVLILLSWHQPPAEKAAEYHCCLLFIIAGVNLVACGNDLVSLFLALELVSIPTYVLLYLRRQEAGTSESATRYFLLSIFSSAVLLYGMSFLYGISGETSLASIRAALVDPPATPIPGLLIVAMVMVIAGLGFRITIVPFHFYAPDVYQGATTSAAAMLAVVPKIAGFVALLRILTGTLLAPQATLGWDLGSTATGLLWILAVASMFAGNLLALLQDNLRRLLAYSGVAHGGYMLVGLAAGVDGGAAVDGRQALLFYLCVYGAMTLGVFAVLATLEDPRRPVETIDDLAGLSQARPVTALCLSVFLFSLTGLPPTAGFWGKLNLFLAAWARQTTGFRLLALVLAINAAIAAYYYLRLIGVMYLSAPHSNFAQVRRLPALAGLGVCAVATVGLFFAPDPLWTATGVAFP